MKIFHNTQQFFLRVHQDVVSADDPTTDPVTREKLYANIYSEIRCAARWGNITPRQYRQLHDAVYAAQADQDREQIDLFGNVE